MITKVSLRNRATFNEEGIQIDNLKKVNFIYGANGSGKTVISNFLTNHEDDNYSESSIDWEHDTPLETLVYNKKFRDDYFSKSTIGGVFTLGKATADEKKVIEDKQVELKNIENEYKQKTIKLNKQEKEKTETENNFTSEVWESIYKRYESNFKDAFRGSMGSKESFKDKLISQFNKNTSTLLSFDELKEKAKTIFENEHEKILPPFVFIHFEELIKIENEDIWSKKIVGKADVNIAQLIQKLDLNDWVNKGREYLQDNEICPFCQQDTITNNFKEQLENYFDKSFTEAIEEIKNYAREYNSSAKNLVGTLNKIEEDEKNNQDTKLAIDNFSTNLRTLSAQFNSNKNSLNSKTKEPSRSIELISTQSSLNNIVQIIREANDKITRHNGIVKNYEAEKKKLITSVWKYVIEKNKGTIERFNRNITGLETGIKNLSTELGKKKDACSALDKEIKTLTQDVTSVQPTVDFINQTLKNFGFSNFKIVPSELENNSYQIQRKNGELANETLSEGEITFITFLYFMQLAKGSVDEEYITNDRILVVDDPISSLDSNVLSVVSSLLKKVITDIKKDEGNIKQIILLTHNVYFHKEVSFISGKTKKCSRAFYWILRKNKENSAIQCYEETNPIQTSYQLLWKELKERERNSGITIQNAMRRIIEHYFKIFGGYEDDDLIEKFNNSEDQTICRSLICWINDGSHAISDDLFIESPEGTNDKYFEVFKKIFLEAGHQSHYSMMMGENEN